MEGAHVHQFTELREPKLPLKIVLDILRDPPEPAHGQTADEAIGNRRHREPFRRHIVISPRRFHVYAPVPLDESQRVRHAPCVARTARPCDVLGATIAFSLTARASPSRFRRNNLARCTRVFTLGTPMLKASAISRFDRPSTSRSTSAVRWWAGSSLIAEVSATRRSVWSDGSSDRGDQSAMGATCRPCSSKSGITSSSERSLRRLWRPRSFW